MGPVFFKSGADLRRWLQKNHETATELLVGFYKKESAKHGITYAMSARKEETRQRRLAQLIDDSAHERRRS